MDACVIWGAYRPGDGSFAPTVVKRRHEVAASSLIPGASIKIIAEWTGEAPAGPHKACYAGSNPVSATLGG